MNELPPGILLLLSAPSGAGKTTLARRLMQELPQAHFSVSVTTRDPRGTERNGIDYEFVDVETFQRRIERGQFVEWAEVHGNFYGSPQASVDVARKTGGVSFFDIDVQGGQSIKRKHPDAVGVFILPPSMEELARRLRARGTDGEETIRRRLLGARSEMDRGVATYDYVIINDDFDRALGDLKAIVTAESRRRGRVKVDWLQAESK
ncbi:MAG TPA: guanylate kinase [Myxococcaceae bacterium]|nr:guanylate kinase [Myxococcaceae bacterium]